MTAWQSQDFLTEALIAYAESLVADARVVVLGHSGLWLSERLAELGARSIHLCDLEAERASAGTAVEVPVAADLVLIPDLGVFARPRDVLARAKTMTGDLGAVLLVAENRASARRSPSESEVPSADVPSGFDYYELYDWVAVEFAHVTMMGQWAFRGVTFAAFGESSNERVSVDMQLAGERSVDRFVVLAAQRDVGCDPYVVVELPSAAANLAGPRDAEVQRSSEQRGSDAELIEELKRRADAAEQRAQAADQQLLKTTSEHEKDVARLEASLVERGQAIRVLEADAQDRERIVQELLDMVAESRALQASSSEAGRSDEGDDRAELRAKLDALALDLARRQAQAQTTEWALAEAELRLRQMSEKTSARSSEPETSPQPVASPQ
jgi:hypothetical protein